MQQLGAQESLGKQPILHSYSSSVLTALKSVLFSVKNFHLEWLCQQNIAIFLITSLWRQGILAGLLIMHPYYCPKLPKPYLHKIKSCKVVFYTHMHMHTDILI